MKKQKFRTGKSVYPSGRHNFFNNNFQSLDWLMAKILVVMVALVITIGLLVLLLSENFGFFITIILMGMALILVFVELFYPE